MLLFRFITFLKYLNSINSCIILILSDNTFLLTAYSSTLYGDFSNFSFDNETFSEINKSPLDVDKYEVNKKILSDDIKMMHEFIEFKYFKKVMKRNNNIIE